ncbi:hypothetical protein [Aliamphritea spongicola]|uniref:hypothetical protein n=1 Tax=Aliamphritea spongicola TaxID=707589 RepID=UPI00196ADFA0|nr:hypothetical protein [Aliamphritea spongicola]MBN3560945.1 hypothetical protein [Aliamphritea spongicola]
MRRSLLAVAIAATLTLPAATAIAAVDQQAVEAAALDTGISQDIVASVAQALDGATTPEAIQTAMQTLLSSTPEAQQQAVITAALGLNSSNPAVQAAIGRAASSANVPLGTVAAASFAANVDSTDVLGATAAGNEGGNTGSGIPSGNTGNTLNNTPSYGSSSGSGGGGTASPS